MTRIRSRIIGALLLSATLASAQRSPIPQQLAFKPYHASGIYGAGETVGWTVTPGPKGVARARLDESAIGRQMNRRQFLALSPAAVMRGQEKRRPNILLILADDLWAAHNFCALAESANQGQVRSRMTLTTFQQSVLLLPVDLDDLNRIRRQNVLQAFAL
jgi:hypothetical protein